ncbi:MAG: hypothetical protein QXK65_01975, partial [Candidatus Micrarchaeaceae archaeon]
RTEAETQKGYGILNIPESESKESDDLVQLINTKRAKIIIIRTGVFFPELYYNKGTIYGKNNIKEFLENNL